MSNSKEHYLKDELYNLVSQEPAVFEFLQEGSLDGIWFWDLENPEHEWMNPKFWTLLGYDPNEMKHLASEWQSLINPDDLSVALDNFEKHCADPNHSYDQVVRYRHKDGSTVWVRCRGVAIRDKSGKPIRMLGAHNDLTALKRAEEQLVEKNIELEKLARRDELTSLPNRLAFGEAFENQLLTSFRQELPLSLAFIDVDNFKSLNDSLGHQYGDKALRLIAHILDSTARASDTVARLSGDEFVMLMYGTAAADSKTAAERLRRAIESHLGVLSGVTVSIGISTLDTFDQTRADNSSEMRKEMLNKADEALYLAKHTGRNRVHHFKDAVEVTGISGENAMAGHNSP